MLITTTELYQSILIMKAQWLNLLEIGQLHEKWEKSIKHDIKN